MQNLMKKGNLTNPIIFGKDEDEASGPKHLQTWTKEGNYWIQGEVNERANWWGRRIHIDPGYSVSF